MMANWSGFGQGEERETSLTAKTHYLLPTMMMMVIRSISDVHDIIMTTNGERLFRTTKNNIMQIPNNLQSTSLYLD